MTRKAAPRPAPAPHPAPGPAEAYPAGTERVRLWDPMLRVYHWLLAGLVILNWCLGKFGPDSMSLHFWCGYAIAALLVLMAAEACGGGDAQALEGGFAGNHASIVGIRPETGLAAGRRRRTRSVRVRASWRRTASWPARRSV